MRLKAPTSSPEKRNNLDRSISAPRAPSQHALPSNIPKVDSVLATRGPGDIKGRKTEEKEKNFPRNPGVASACHACWNSETLLEMAIGKSAVIIGKYALCRAALRNLLELEVGVRVIGEAAGPAELIDVLRDCAPDILVLEQSLPNCSAAEASIYLAELEMPPQFLVLIEEAEYRSMTQLYTPVTATVLLKSAEPVQLIDQVRSMTEGGIVTGRTPRGAPATARRHVRSSFDRGHGSAGHLELLSDTQLRIIDILESGAPNKRIASVLGIAEQTVKNHLANLYRRFGVRNRLGLLLSPGLRAARSTTLLSAVLSKNPTPVAHTRGSAIRPIGQSGVMRTDAIR